MACQSGIDRDTAGLMDPSLRPYLHIRPNIARALAAGGPIVALETAVLTHGLAHPTNLSVVREMMADVRETGAEPAVVGVVDGRIEVGLDGAKLEALSHNPETVKLSARDLPWALACRKSGGTTVAATLAVCQAVGLSVFATGGIGGVHRHWTVDRDISADLTELARSRCCVVSAGAKSVLDLPATLQALESHSVSVVGWQTDWFPQFHSRGEGDLAISRRVNDLDTLAKLCLIRWHGLKQGGVLLANPIPKHAALPQKNVDHAVAQAVAKADAEGIRGAAVTPFLLAELERLTDGQSVRANLALLRNNAVLAGQLAVALANAT